MKYRNDFVTNSSSSSFVIAFKEHEDDGNKASSLLNAFARLVLDSNSHYETTEASYFTRLEGLKAYLRREYYDDYTVDDLLGNGSGDYKEADVGRLMDEGYTIAIKDVSYHDETTREMLDALSAHDDAFIILSADND